MTKTVTLKFSKDAWYNDVLIASAGETKELSTENGFAFRWLSRGAELVEEVKEEIKEVKEVKLDKVVVKEEDKKAISTSKRK